MRMNLVDAPNMDMAGLIKFAGIARHFRGAAGGVQIARDLVGSGALLRELITGWVSNTPTMMLFAV
jgi:hypothetical protein